MTPGSMGCRHGNSMNLTAGLQQSSWVTGCIVSEQSSVLSSRSQQWLKILSEPRCNQMCCHPGFAVPCIERRQSGPSIIIKDPGIFRMVSEHSPAALAAREGVSLSFDALKPGTDASSAAVKVLDGLFQ